MAGDTDQTTLAVLRQLIDHGPLTRPELGERAGFGRATTSAIVNDLMRRELVAEIATPPRGRGRPVALLDLDDDRYAVTGLDIGFDRVLAAVYSLRGRQLARVERAARVEAVNPRGLLRHAATVLHEALDLAEQDGRSVLGVGVSVAGLVDASSGTIKYAPSLGWRDVALSAGVAEALGGRAPVLLDNDANFAALAERRHRQRGGPAVNSLVFLTGTYGISAGIITGGRLWRGEHGMAGEVGHLMVDPDGRRCACGRRGCLDTRAGLTAIIDDALAAGDRPRRAGRAASGPATGLDDVVSAAQAGDEALLTSLADSGRWLGRGAAIVCAMLDPGSVVLGGHYARLAQWILPAAREAFTEALLMPSDDGRQLTVSALDAAASAEGAALAVLMAVAEGAQALPE